MPHHSKKITTWLLLLITACTAAAQDTLRYTVPEAETVFLRNNLQLLAEKLNISQADARILQAKAWPNPSFTLDEINLWATPRQTGGDIVSPAFPGGWGKNQQFAMQLEQLVQTARKRKKSIALEAEGKALAERTFTDMLYALRAEFRQTAAALLYYQRLQHDLDVQQTLIAQLLTAQTGQYALGNIPEAELVRLQALQFSLRSEINELQEAAGEHQLQLKTLMAGEPRAYLELKDDTASLNTTPLQPLDALLTAAGEHNPALRAAAAEVRVNEAAYRLERSRRVPDLRLNMQYDRNGSTMLDFVGFGVAVDLPFFDRNKGPIRVAGLQVQQSELHYRHRTNEVYNNVVKTYADLQNALRTANMADARYLYRLDALMQGMGRNFLQRNIGLLEFLDFFSSIRENKQRWYQALRSIAIHKETLNYLTGSDL